MKKLVNRHEFLKLSALTAVGTAPCLRRAGHANQGACADGSPGGQGRDHQGPGGDPGAGCGCTGLQRKVPEATKAPAAAAGAFKEAPMLAQLVKDGKLPAVDTGLPKKPAVFKVRKASASTAAPGVARSTACRIAGGRPS